MTAGGVASLPGRDLGFADAGGALPDVLVDAVVLLTQLGDPWFVLVAVALFYLFGRDRRRGALAVALVMAALALVLALKNLFAFPRPPAAVRLTAADGFGFPSGHAVGSTVAWGALAVLADVWTRRRRLLTAGAVVAAVSASRVVLGVHYVADVVVGVAVGLALLAGTLRVARGDPARAFLVAAVIAVAAVAVGGGDDAAASVGATVGAGLAWTGLDLDGRAVALLVGVLGLALFGGLWGAVTATGPAAPLALVTNAVAGAGVVALPRISDAVEGQLPRPLRNFPG